MIEVIIENGEAVERELSAEEVAAALGPLDGFKASLCDQVNSLRDARISAGFMFDGLLIQSRATDRENISALAADADKAIGAGAQAGDYAWHPKFPDGFGFITADNTIVPMDAQTMVRLRERGFEFKADQTFYARTLKDAINAAADHAAVGAINYSDGWPA